MDIKSLAIRWPRNSSKIVSGIDRVISLCPDGRQAGRRNGDDIRETATDPGSGGTKQ
jgi:hypothetical protein